MTHLTKLVKRTTRTEDKLPHGVRETLVVALYPGGVLMLREQGRRKSVTCGLGWLYALLLKRAADQEKRERKARRGRRA